MTNHIVTKPESSCKMYLTSDKKFVVTEITIVEKRPVKYYKEQLLMGLL